MTRSPWAIDQALIDWLKANLSRGKTILELGSGEGTVDLLKYWKVYSIEHNKKYLNIPDHNYIYAPYEKHKAIENYPGAEEWYNRQALKEGLKDLAYDLILVDGPPGDSRAGLIKYWKLFNPNVIWVFDDLQREMDKKIIHGMSNRLERPYMVYNAWGRGKPFGVIDANHRINVGQK